MSCGQHPAISAAGNFAREGEPVLLKFQNRAGSVPPYQVRQLIAMIEKYGEPS